jgi:hypothetical protein
MLGDAAPDIQARRARQDDERRAGPQQRRGLGRCTLEAADLGDAAGETQADVMAPQLVIEPLVGHLLVSPPAASIARTVSARTWAAPRIMRLRSVP